MAILPDLYAFFHEGAFSQFGPSYGITRVQVSADGTITYGGFLSVSFEQFKDDIRQGRLVTQLPEGAKVTIGIGISCVATQVFSGVEEAEFVKEVEDQLRELRGEPTTSFLCNQALREYAATPSEATIEHLRRAYEAMPKHRRIFLREDEKIKTILGLA